MDWTAYALNFLAAIAILGAGLWGSGRVGNLIRHLGLKYPQLDVTLFGFLGSLARWAIIALTIIIVLGQFGVETTSLIAHWANQHKIRNAKRKQDIHVMKKNGMKRKYK